MKRIAILGGGIAGLAAAYELELARKRGADIDWHLYEATDRLGGTVETTTRASGDEAFILEGGPDAWVTDKPWARDLAVELGLAADFIESNDATRRTYILLDGRLQPMPDRMRMMVPENLATLDNSPLFSASAKAAYAQELASAAQLRETTPTTDESVSTFVRRHFGDEVLTKLAAPLLSGVFGGDVDLLSVRSVMPAFVAMEREHGSLIAALQSRARARGSKPPSATFTTLRRGMGSLVEALVATLPADRLHLGRTVTSLKRESNLWCVRSTTPALKNKESRRTAKRHVHSVLLATPIDSARELLAPLDPEAAALIPTTASSALLVSFAWTAEQAATFTIPTGFGFLVPQHETPQKGDTSQLLACTFTDQKFPGRVPTGARAIRVFFGGHSAEALMPLPDADIAAHAFTELRHTLNLPQLPEASLNIVRRWPRSLPQYEVGHLDRIAQLDERIAALKGLTLLGNGYRGVGVPDLIRDARAAARSIAS